MSRGNHWHGVGGKCEDVIGGRLGTGPTHRSIRFRGADSPLERSEAAILREARQSEPTTMKIQRLLIALTVVNLGLLVFQVTRLRPLQAQSGPPVLRGRELEIVDDQGRVRASIKVLPGNQAVKLPDGKPFPETVILRLIDPNGRPSVKLATSVQGAGLGLGGDTDATYVALKAEGTESSLKMTNKDGREQLIKP
jgi:hypothetical protein